MNYAHIEATATGYDVITIRGDRRRRYTNVSAASIRRFYRLSDGDISQPIKPRRLLWKNHQLLAAVEMNQ